MNLANFGVESLMFSVVQLKVPEGFQGCANNTGASLSDPCKQSSSKAFLKKS